MLKKLIKLLTSWIDFDSKNKKEMDEPKEELLPELVDNKEKIIRTIYSPSNVNPRTNKLKANVFKSPPEIDEVSVNRLDYTTPDFCKKIGRRGENPNSKRNYYGFAILNADEIRSLNSEVVYSPILEPVEKKNIFHADIKIGFNSITGVELPAEFKFKVDSLVKKARFYVDRHPLQEEWAGEDLK